MKNIFGAIVAAVMTVSGAFAGEGPAKVQAPVAKCTTGACESTVMVARSATWRERRNLMVVEPVKVVEVKKVEVVKVAPKVAASCDCCEVAPAAVRSGLLGRVRGRTRTVVGSAVDCVTCK